MLMISSPRSGAILILDKELRYIGKQAFYQKFHIKEDDAEGVLFYDWQS